MDEEREDNKEFKSHVPEKLKVESSFVSPATGPPDVTVLHHNSDSDKRLPLNNDESGFRDPVEARHLDSVYQYTSKIRQFIGLVDPNDDKPAIVSSPESEIPGDISTDANDPNLEKNDDVNEKLTNSDQDKDDADLTTKDDTVSISSNPSLVEIDTNVEEPVIHPNKNNKELLPLSVDNVNEKPCVIEFNEDSGQCEENEREKPQIQENDGDYKQNLLPVTLEDAETPIINSFDNNKVAPIDVTPYYDEKNLQHETNEQNLTDDMNVTLPDKESESIIPELNKKDLNMSIHLSNEKMETPLLESKVNACETFDHGVDLNPQENILKTEEAIPGENENNLENEANSDSNASILKNEELTTSLVATENPKAIDEPYTSSNTNEENNSSVQNSNFVEDNFLNNLSNELYAISEEQDSSANPEEIEQTPHFDDIRRLSVEIVNKVLDTAGTQLKDILNEKRKSNADANSLLERSPDLDVTCFPHEAAATALNFGSVNDSRDSDKNNLTMIENDNSQLSEKSEVKQKLNNEVQLKEVLAKTYDSNDFQKKIEVEMNKFDPKYDVDPDIVCGIGCFRPRWIQPWATSRVYLILYSIIGILSGSYYSYLIGAISTLEKRFAFKSKTSGFVMMLDEITPLLLGIVIGYFGGKSHRPRMVGFGMLLASLCCFISALPYFIYGPASHLSLGYSVINNETKLELCNADVREEFCGEEDRLPTLTPVILLMFGSFLKGFGNLAYYAVGLAYMDDNAKKKNTPMYFAVAFSLRLLGPMVGFLMSSFFLKFYENPFVDPGFDSSDPRWIGCWWMGFLVQGVLLLIFTIPISLFPRRLPGTIDYSKTEEGHHFLTSFVGLFAALKRLAKNPVYCILVSNTIMGVFGSFGHYINIPRYFENQFRLSASISSLIAAPPSIGATMISITVGGYLIWRFKPSGKFLAGALFAAEVLQTCSYLYLMIPTCQKVELTSYGYNDVGLILQSECNNNCNCTTDSFSPVCGPDGTSLFFSPCHAGCSGKVNGTYTNCSCVSDSSGQDRNYVTDGFCVSENCWPSILAYVLTMPFVQLIVNLARVGHTMIFLRSIKPEDKSVALGAYETLVCLFGFIPYPVVYGALVDSACLIWEKSCGETGNCWYYDVPKLNYLLHGTSALFTSFDALTMLAVFLLASRVPDLYKDDCESDGNTNVEKNETGLQEERKDSNSIIKI